MSSRRRIGGGRSDARHRDRDVRCLNQSEMVAWSVTDLVTARRLGNSLVPTVNSHADATTLATDHDGRLIIIPALNHPIRGPSPDHEHRDRVGAIPRPKIELGGRTSTARPVQ